MEAFSKSCLTAPRINPIESDGTSLLSAPCTPQLDESSGISDCSILHSILSMRLCQPQVLHIPQDSTNCFRHGCWTWSAGVNAVSIHWGGGAGSLPPEAVLAGWWPCEDGHWLPVTRSCSTCRACSFRDGTRRSGFVYELHSTMRPLYGTRTLDGTQSCVRPV